MARDDTGHGVDELRQARRRSRGLFWAVGLFSVFVNLLLLTGPLYMLNVYDRVLGSRSVETLLALTVLVAFLYGMMAVLDLVRGRIMTRAGARFQDDLEERVFRAALKARSRPHPPREAATALRDLEGVQRLIAAPVAMAVFDLPWTPIFLAGIFVFHPLMGWLAVAGGLILVGIALLNRLASAHPLQRLQAATVSAESSAGQILSEAEAIRALGMQRSAFARWHEARRRALVAAVAAADRTGGFGALTKAFRLFLQSAMLGLGAWLVLRGQLTPGAMIAGSILLGRALQPIELMVNQWAVVQRGREGWRNLARLLAEVPPDEARTSLPRPRAIVEAHQVTVVPPGEQAAALRMVSFRVEPGQALGVIGPSGAGKSTLARALTGIWPTAGGKIRLDGVALDQFDADALGQLIGYLPQRVALFEGTIKDNIARLSPEPDDAAVVEAAKAAAAHEMILSLPDGYDTRVDASGGRLSGGQVQRIGLARAMYGDPVMLVLDEPNSNLDHTGTMALNAAIARYKASGRAVFIMAHRPAAIAACDLLLYLDRGARRAFGPRDEVLAEVTSNADALLRGGSGGVT